MLPVEYTILITDISLVYVGDPIVCWTTLDVTLRFNQPGSGEIVVPAYDWVLAQMGPGHRVVLIRHQPDTTGLASEVLMSGPIEKWKVEQSDGNDANAGVGILTINFGDDLARVVARQTYQDPALAPGAQTTANWTYSGNGELALRALFDGNAGPGALVARREPGLVLGAIHGVGTAVTAKADLMEPLGDVARRVALAAGGLGFTAKQLGGQVVLDVYQPTDASTTVLFGFALGNMKYRSWEVTAPSATVALVGGQGTGATSLVHEYTNTSPGGVSDWGRMETLVSMDGTSPTADLDAAAAKAFTDGGEKVMVTASVIDTTDQRYGINYDLGSKVSMETVTGSALVDIVTLVHIQAWATAGELVFPTVGAQDNEGTLLWLQRIRQLEDEIKRLARNVLPG